MAQDKEPTTHGTPEQGRDMHEAQKAAERAQNAENARQQNASARADKVHEVWGDLHYSKAPIPDNQEWRIAGIAVDRNFSKGGKAETTEVDSAQANSIALAADFMANMGAGETLQYAVQHGMSVMNTKDRNAVRYAAAVEAVGIYLKQEYPGMQAQNVDALVQAAVPVARDMVKERQ